MKNEKQTPKSLEPSSIDSEQRWPFLSLWKMPPENTTNQTIWYTYHHANEKHRYYFCPSLKIATRINPISRSNDFIVLNRQPFQDEIELNSKQDTGMQAQDLCNSLKGGASSHLSVQSRLVLLLVILYWKFIHFFTSPIVALCLLIGSGIAHTTEDHFPNSRVSLPLDWEQLQRQYTVHNVTCDL